MKKIITFLLAVLGLSSACGQQRFENTDVNGFAELVDSPDVVVLDVRTAKEFDEGHIERAVNIDQSQDNFIEQAKSLLPTGKTIAVYCRSGKRSANAAGRLAAEGYKPINLEGGINAWKNAGKPVTTNTYEVDVFKTKNGQTVKFHALMHASIRVEWNGKEIEIDPVRQLGDRSIDYAAMPKADYILVTHEHQDHFDRETLKALTKTGTRLVTNSRCASLNDGWGLVMKNGETQDMQFAFTIEAVPAYNTTEGHTQFHPKGRDNGYILNLDGLRIYVAGDTEDIPEMASLKDIDIAFLPCNQPYTMTPDQLLHAARMVKPRVVFPYHYGQTDVSSLPAQLQAEGMDVRIRHYE